MLVQTEELFYFLLSFFNYNTVYYIMQNNSRKVKRLELDYESTHSQIADNR